MSNDICNPGTGILGRIPLLLLIVSALAGATACQTSPTGREQFVAFPEAEVEQMGVQAFTDLKGKQPIDHDPVDNAYVKCVAEAITSVLPDRRSWEVVVFKSDEVNAFALPGAKIGVYSGMLKVATTPDQLAAVIGHETGHVIAQHGRERVSDQLATQVGLQITAAMLNQKNPAIYQVAMAGLGLGTQVGILLPFSRAQESEADLIGLQTMAKAGFDPRQSIELWNNMTKAVSGQPPEWLSDHPSNQARINQLQAHMADAIAIYNASGHKPNCRR